MGRDKAWIRVDGETLILRQLRLLRESGAGRLLVSVAAGTLAAADRFQTELPQGVVCLPDARPDGGPLLGIAGALGALQAGESHLVVLAVDLPRLCSEVLETLVEAARLTPESGVVPRVAGNLEPLVAVYPRAGLAPALTRIGRGELSVQDWVREGLTAGWMRERLVAGDEADAFLNWNRPEDLPGARI
jgi:molybdopterin-guanine dinucleotide biosynthesis protein A